MLLASLLFSKLTFAASFSVRQTLFSFHDMFCGNLSLPQVLLFPEMIFICERTNLPSRFPKELFSTGDHSR